MIKRDDKNKELAVVRRHLAKDYVVGVFVFSDGRLIDITSDNLDTDLPKNGKLYTQTVGQRGRLVQV